MSLPGPTALDESLQLEYGCPSRSELFGVKLFDGSSEPLFVNEVKEEPADFERRLQELVMAKEEEANAVSPIPRMDEEMFEEDLLSLAEGLPAVPKEEEVEIKTEPIDDFGEFETAEEEPIADIFYPNRSALGDFDEFETAEEKPIADIFCPNSGSSRPRLEDVYPASFAGMDMEEEGPSTRACYICGVFTDRYCTTATLSQKQRREFLLALVSHPDMDRNRVQMLNGHIDDVFFCRAHFSSKQIGKDQYRLDNPECDLCWVPVPPMRSSPDDWGSARKFFESITRLTIKQREKMEWFRDHKGYIKSVCSKHFEPEPEPEEPSSSTADTVKTETKQKTDRLDGKRKRKPPRFYAPKGFSEYFRKKKKNESEEPAEPPKPAVAGYDVQYAVPKKSASKRFCDLCDAVADSYVTSPIYSMFARKFFDNLIHVTAAQRERIERFLKIDKRATVCSKHLKKEKKTKSMRKKNQASTSSSSRVSTPMKKPKEETEEKVHKYSLRAEKKPKQKLSL